MLRRLLSGAPVLALALALPCVSTGQTPPPPEWSVNTSTTIKPEFRQEFEGIQKEISAAYKKAGAPYRLVVQTLLGDIEEYTSITPLGKFADMDGPSVLEKALGDAPAQKILRRIGGYLLSAHRVTTIAMNDISIRTAIDAGGFGHVTFWQLAPGKGPDFVAFMQSDYLPAMRKAGVANLWLSQIVFGGDLNERVMVRPMRKLAEIDAGPLATKALGPEGARQLAVKQAAIVQSTHFTIVRVRPDLSLMPPPPKGKSTE